MNFGVKLAARILRRLTIHGQEDTTGIEAECVLATRDAVALTTDRIRTLLIVWSWAVATTIGITVAMRELDYLDAASVLGRLLRYPDGAQDVIYAPCLVELNAACGDGGVLPCPCLKSAYPSTSVQNLAYLI